MNKKKIFNIIGIMTGTSMDGIDLSYISTDGINKVKIFGFHFASLDIRQDSRIHSKVFEEIISHPNTSKYDSASVTPVFDKVLNHWNIDVYIMM